MLRAVLETGAPISDVEITGQTPGAARGRAPLARQLLPGPAAPRRPGRVRRDRRRDHRAQAPGARRARSPRRSASCSPRARTSTELLERAASIMVPELADSCGDLPPAPHRRRPPVRGRARGSRRWRGCSPTPTGAGRSTSPDARLEPELREGQPVMVAARHAGDAVGVRRRTRSTSRSSSGSTCARRSSRRCTSATTSSALLFLDYTGALGTGLPARRRRAGRSARRPHRARARARVPHRPRRTRAPGPPRPARRGERAADRRARHPGAARSRHRRRAPDVRRRVRRVPRRGGRAGGPRSCKLAGGAAEHRASTLGRHPRRRTSHGPGPVATAFRTREPVLVSEVPDRVSVSRRRCSACTRSSSSRCSPPTNRSACWCSATRARVGGTARDDLGLAREIAGRVAPAVEDAMRFERELATAEALQRSLLPDQLPVLQDADLATRYVPGRRRAEGRWRLVRRGAAARRARDARDR